MGVGHWREASRAGPEAPTAPGWSGSAGGGDWPASHGESEGKSSLGVVLLERTNDGRAALLVVRGIKRRWWCMEPNGIWSERDGRHGAGPHVMPKLGTEVPTILVPARRQWGCFDLWRRGVLPRCHDLWRQPPRSRYANRFLMCPNMKIET